MRGMSRGRRDHQRSEAKEREHVVVSSELDSWSGEELSPVFESKELSNVESS